MRPAIKMVAVIIVVTILAASMSFAFTQMANAPMLTKALNGIGDVPLPDSGLPNILGNAFIDLNGNGLFDLGEGISGLLVNLFDRNGKYLGNTTTGPDGSYRFPGMDPGNYTIECSGGQNGTEANTTSDVTLGTDKNCTIDLKLPPSSIVSGTVYSDKDGDGKPDTGEGVSGLDVGLFDSNGTLMDSTKTSSNGSYSFTGLDPGNYSAEVLSSGSDRFGAGTNKSFDLDPLENKTVDLPLPYLTDTLNGTAYQDLDGDGEYDKGEGVGDAVVQLFDRNGTLVGTTQTDTNGSYSFEGVDPGNYTIKSLVAGQNDTILSSSSNVTFTGSGDNETDMVFPPISTYLSGRIFEDRDGDGEYDPGEGVPRTGVWLINDEGNRTGFTRTDENGSYGFSPLEPGNYSVETSVSGQNLTGISVGRSGNDSADIAIPHGSSLNGTIYQDLDGDGMFDEGEGVPDIDVRLFDGNGTQVGYTRTDEGGNYSFAGLPKGDYSVKPVLIGDRGANGTETSLDGIGNVTTDIGLPPLNGTLSGRVFQDQDGDGQYDPGEGVPYAEVKLFDLNGTQVGKTTSGEDGSYMFYGLEAGDYVLNATKLRDGDLNGTANDNISISDHSNLTADLGLSKGSKGDDRIDTRTDITEVPSTVRKGTSFIVKVSVTTTYGQPISGVLVDIIVVPFKGSDDRTVIGSGMVNGGTCSIQCSIPSDLDLGTYQLIAETKGNSIYGPSDSDPEVQVRDDSKIIIDCPSRVVLDRQFDFVITLEEDASSKVVPNANVVVTVNGPLTYVTDQNGTVSMHQTFTSTGNHTLTAMFPGNDDLLSTTVSWTVEVLDVEVEVIPSQIVRGETNSLYCVAHAEELVVGNQSIAVSFDGDHVGNIVTDENGNAGFDLSVGPEVTLGNHQLSFDMLGIHPVDKTIPVLSRTTMVLQKTGAMVNVTLFDDHNIQLSGMRLNLTGADENMTAITAAGISSHFDLDSTKEANYTVVFGGSAIYTPSTFQFSYSPPPVPGPNDMWTWLLALVAVAVIAAVLVFLYLRKRDRSLPIGQPTAALSETRTADSPYYITFPTISEPLPRVWGENEPLRFRVSGGSGELDISIGGPVTRIRVENEGYETEATLPKGRHTISVSGPLGTTSVEVRIVNYREEIVDIYKGHVEAWKSSVPGVTDALAPRELQMAVEKDPVTKDPAALDMVISLFEIAEFSLRRVGRGEYERMFLSSERMGV